MTRSRDLNHRQDAELNMLALTLLLDRLADERPTLGLRADTDEMQRQSGRFVGQEH